MYTLTVRIWGLTGNIGSGKSTVGRMLAAHGIPVVDADQVAREVVEPGRPALRDIAARFPGVLRPDGSLDRKALAARVFADPGEREALNAIVHPAVGIVEVDCEILLSEEQDQRLLVFSAPPGSPAVEQLEFLAVIGVQ